MTLLHGCFRRSDAARPDARLRLCLCLLMAGVILELATPVPVAAANPAFPANTTGVVSDFFYHTDDLYNVMAITDDTGAVADAGNERYEYADYGQPVDIFTIDKITGTPSAIGNPYLFTGRRYDSETGWYYYRTRYLDPVAGRFTIRDVIDIRGERLNLGNLYSYVGTNPMTRFDPTGQGTKYRQVNKKPTKCVCDPVMEMILQCLENKWCDPNSGYPAKFTCSLTDQYYVQRWGWTVGYYVTCACEYLCTHPDCLPIGVTVAGRLYSQNAAGIWVRAVDDEIDN